MCPPLIAALAGAVLDRCSDFGAKKNDWLQRGLEVAVQLATAATRSEPALLPRGCTLPND